MGKQSTPKNQTVTNVTQLPAWVDSSAQENLSQAKTVAANLAMPYDGQTVAGTNDDQTNAYQLTRNASGMALPGYQTAQNTLDAAQGYNAPSVKAGLLSSTNLSPYLNPYTQNVIDATMATNQQALDGSLKRTGDQAASAGAFGGSRQGVMEGVARAQNSLGMANTAAQLNSQNFTQAQAAASADLARQLQADQGNQSAAQAAQNSRVLAAAQGGSNASAMQNSALQSASALQSVGASRQAQDQANIDAKVNYYNAVAQHPVDQLTINQSTLMNTPYGKSQTTTGPATTQGSSGLMQGLGAASSLAGIGSSLFSGGASSAASGLLGLLALSDENDKTDIQKLGKDPTTGVDLHAYRYKGDPKNTPKTVGPMAQDIEKKFPGSTKKIGGHRVVDSSKLPPGVGQHLGFGGPTPPAGMGGLLSSGPLPKGASAVVPIPVPVPKGKSKVEIKVTKQKGKR